MLKFERLLSKNLFQPVQEGYKFPFSKVHFMGICQGYNGPYGHFAFRKGGEEGYTIDNTFSIDFALPFGTKITPARSGIVDYVYKSDDLCYRGMDIDFGMQFIPHSIVVDHFDGTYTLYSQLDYDSIRVVKGQMVNKNTILGKTGESGWVGDIPNLHFSAFKRKEKSLITFPVRFDEFDRQLWHDRIWPEE